MSKPSTALIIPDCHIPYHDRHALRLCLEVGKDLKKNTNLEEIILIGDLFDFKEVSPHDKSTPEKTLKEVIYSNRDVLEELTSLFKKQKIVYIIGNHEAWLTRKLEANKGISDITSIEEILELKKYGIESIPYNRNQKYNVLGTSLLARHEGFDGGINCSLGSLKKGGNSVVFGHTHRVQAATMNKGDGSTIRAYNIGSLIDKSCPAFNYMRGKDNWAQAFGIAYRSGNDAVVQTIEIVNGSCFWGGKQYA